MPNSWKEPVSRSVYLVSNDLHRKIAIKTPEYIPCHERLFNGGEAPQKKEMAPQCHLFFNQYYLPRR